VCVERGMHGFRESFAVVKRPFDSPFIVTTGGGVKRFDVALKTSIYYPKALIGVVSRLYKALIFF
jgi:hypothetical protein